MVAGAGHSQGQRTAAEGRWQWNVCGGRTGQTGPRAPEEFPFPIPQYLEAG